MSRWRSVWLVAKREILERGRSRGFVFSVLFTTVLVVGSFIVPTLLFGDEETTRIGLVEPAPPGLDARDRGHGRTRWIVPSRSSRSITPRPLMLP